MSEIFVINQIQMSHEGPVNKDNRLIHLQQGSLDGACGPYCLFMSLIICGLVREHDRLVGLEAVRKNSATGKALIKMEELAFKESGSLFRNGTELSHLQEIANSHGFVVTEFEEARKISKRSNEYKEKKKTLSTTNVKKFVIDQVKNNHPVILWLHSDGNCDHWVVVVGLEYRDDSDREKNKVSRFLLLDPDAPSPTVSAWNGAIKISSRKELHSWGSHLDTMDVRLDKALSIKRKK